MNRHVFRLHLLALGVIMALLFGYSPLNAQCLFDIKDYPPTSTDCSYVLVLSDTGGNGWDGASIDVSVSEAWPASNYKVTTTDANCLIIPIYVNDGETIDLTYWNGAFEDEHGFTLYDGLGNIALDENGVAVDYASFPPANIQIRTKVACPLNSCNGADEDFIVRITTGNFPEEQSWEIYDGAASTSAQGNQVIGVNGNSYAGYAPGTQVEYPVSLDLCDVYTFVAFDSFNDGWDSGHWEILSTNNDYGTPLTDTDDPLFGSSLILESAGFGNDEERVEFTLPCKPNCEDVLITNAVNCEIVDPTLPIPAAEICYPDCNHAEGCDIIVEQFILPFGVEDAAISGGAFVYTGSGSIVFPGTYPAGQHQFVTKFTYCDGIMVKCTSNLSIVGSTNPSMACNDNVLISLGAPQTDELEECTVTISPDMVLEMPSFCEGEYLVNVIGANGNNLGNTVGPDQLMQTLTYNVQHIASGNVCWGTLTVEDKLAPVINCNDYELDCTHPHALDEDYYHKEDYPTVELPANIAGGLPGLPSNTWLPVHVACQAKGEILTNIWVNLVINHTRLEDLQIYLHAPASLGYGPILIANNGRVQEIRKYDIHNLNLSCHEAASTLTETFVTENSGAVLPANYGNTWYIQVVDNTVNGNNDGVAHEGEIINASLTLKCGFPTPVDAYDCSLEGVTLLNEMIAETNCDQSDWNGAQIIRTYQAIDKFGNASTCTQTVSLKAPQLDDIELPTDVEVACTGQSPDEITPEISGGLNHGCFDLTEELHGLCDISYTYNDVVLNTCGDGYKIIRTWTILNWCSGVSKSLQQIIKVEDIEGPSIAQDNVTVGTGNYACAADVSLLDLGITDDCSGVGDVIASYTQGGGAYQGDGTLVIVDLTNGGTLEGLPLGETQVEITAKDQCLNASTKLITITVEDDTAPIAICDDELHISLGADGTARVSAADVDEGSYDNCGIASLEIRRIDGCLGESAWDEYVSFACCDVDELVTIELRVTDNAGNQNICWKSALIEDALPPVIVCPEDKTINCDDPSIHAPFGIPSYDDNCEASISSTDYEDIDECQAGILRRTWTATDGSSKSADVSCSQTITINHVSDFIVQFPVDVTIDSCPDDLGATGEPTISDDDCELVAVSSEDQIFDLVSDACYKIERTWTIINWCVYDQGNPANTDLGIPQPLPRTYQDDDGYFTWVQTIKVLDDTAPVINCPGDLVFTDLSDDCEGYADLTIYASDACSDDAALTYSYKIDANNDGTFDIIDTGNDASGLYPYGTHAIKWIVEDGCGNSSECTHLFTIEDAKKPTPVCLNGISLPTMNSNGCVDVWASDLLEYAFDNCSADEYVENSVKIRLAGDLAAPQPSLTLCCEQLGTVIVEIWVSDEAGNTDFCTTYIIVQDNSGVCAGNPSAATIAGTIETEAGEEVELVDVEIDGGFTNALPTDNAGDFAFPDLVMFQDYTVIPEKDLDPTNGVSTYDLVLMSQHILGIETLDSPYAMIAADVNNDGNITTFDIVQTRQLILYIIEDFPNNTSWRFVDKGYLFPDTNNPWMEAFPEVIDITNLSQDELNADFIGVKVGDVNGSAVPNSILGEVERTTNNTLVLAIDDATVNAGETFTVDFRAQDFVDVLGYQFTMKFDADAATFEAVEAGALNVSDANFGLDMLAEGVITTSWNSTAKSIANDDVLFSMTFTANASTTISDLVSINSRYTKAEAYNTTEEMDVNVAFNTTNGTLMSNEAFELFQNTPNPFNGETLIGFNLPEASTATLRVFDVSGKVLKVVEGQFTKGYNTISIQKSELNTSGILYYELNNGTSTATKKMIILD